MKNLINKPPLGRLLVQVPMVSSLLFGGCAINPDLQNKDTLSQQDTIVISGKTHTKQEFQQLPIQQKFMIVGTNNSSLNELQMDMLKSWLTPTEKLQLGLMTRREFVKDMSQSVYGKKTIYSQSIKCEGYNPIDSTTETVSQLCDLSTVEGVLVQIASAMMRFDGRPDVPVNVFEINILPEGENRNFSQISALEQDVVIDAMQKRIQKTLSFK